MIREGAAETGLIIERTDRQNPIRVINISRSDLNERIGLIGENDPLVGTGINDWEETDGLTPIVNTDAGPCVILFFHNTETDRIISGHFSDLRSVRTLAREPGRTVREVARVINPKLGTMVERVESWMSTGVGSNIQLYLFGQNPLFSETAGGEEELRVTMENSKKDQEAVARFFWSLGIEHDKTQDFRVPGTANVDDTFYSPKDRVIYHAIWDRRPKMVRKGYVDGS